MFPTKLATGGFVDADEQERESVQVAMLTMCSRQWDVWEREGLEDAVPAELADVDNSQARRELREWPGKGCGQVVGKWWDAKG